MIVSDDKGASMAWVHASVNACDDSVAERINVDASPAATWKRGCRKTTVAA